MLDRVRSKVNLVGDIIWDQERGRSVIRGKVRRPLAGVW